MVDIPRNPNQGSSEDSLAEALRNTINRLLEEDRESQMLFDITAAFLSLCSRTRLDFLAESLTHRFSPGRFRKLIDFMEITNLIRFESQTDVIDKCNNETIYIRWVGPDIMKGKL